VNRRSMLLWLMLAGMIVLPQMAQAQIMNIDLNNLSQTCSVLSKGGTPSGNTSLFNGLPGNPDACNKNGGIFSRFFCITHTTLGLVLGSTFCAIRDAWMAPFAAMMLLMMVSTGIGFVTGILNFTAKEVSIIIAKMALVTMFVTNADIAMDVAYRFYLGIMQGTVGMLREGFAGIASGNPNTDLPFITQGADFTNAMKNTVGTGDPFASVDTSIADIQGATMKSPKTCSVIALLLVLMVFPPAIFFILGAVISFLGFFARAAYGYLYALVITTFLIAAMPIFVSVALFRTTKDLFEHWLKYIGSNVIQIFIVFAIMAFAAMLDFGGFFRQLGEMIVPHKWVLLSLGVFGDISITVCSVCDPKFRIWNGIITIPPSPESPCLSKTGLSLSELFQHKFFLPFIITNAAALYILSNVMQEFIKMGPDMAKMLGGSKLAHVIGGTSARGDEAVTTPIHTATQRFEQGFHKTADNDQKLDKNKNRSALHNSGIGQAWRAITGGFQAAGNEEYHDIDDELYVRRENDAYHTNRASKEERDNAMNMWRAAATDARWVYDEAGKGHIDMDKLREINANSSKALQQVERTSGVLEKETGLGAIGRGSSFKMMAKGEQKTPVWESMFSTGSHED